MAALYHHNILSPGQWGINLQEQNQPLHPNWATKADGFVLDASNLLKGRGSITITTTQPASAELLRLFNYITSAGVETIISTTATKILQSVADLTSAGNDITPTGTPTNGFWKFLNFNGKVLAWQAGHTPLVWSGSGDFATISVSDGGTLPDGDCAHAAFGRVWAVDDDKQTVRYSGLLDETKWATASGAGSIDMRNVWSQGMDYVTGISSLGANLVIFGRKHIVVYTDGSGSALGVDPAQMYVVDIVEGTGCVSRDSIVQVGEGDLVYLAELGVQSLRRVIQSKDNPLVTISWQIADRIAGAVQTEIGAQASAATDVRGFTGIYLPTTGQYMLIHNNGSVEDVYVFHMDSRTADDKGRELVPITLWDTAVLTNFRSAVQKRGGTVYFTGGVNNHINTYNPDGTADNGLTGIFGDYESGWMTWADPNVDALTKMLKFVQVAITNASEDSASLTLKYGVDFNPTLDELSASESSDNPVRNLYDTTGQTEGQYYKVGLESTRFGGKQIEQVSMHMKLGRPAFVHDRDGQGDPTIVVPSTDLQLLVALSNNGSGGANLQRIATSNDGVTWTLRTASQVATWTGLCYSPELSLLVAVAANAIMTSPDGITWTTRTSPANGTWTSVCWSPTLDLFVAVGSGLSQQRVMTSPDGITWTVRATPSNGDLTWATVIWCEFLRAFVAGATGNSTTMIMTSPDGITWTVRTTSTTGVSRLACSNSLIIGINDGDGDFIYSYDGITWTEGTFTSGKTSLAYSPDLDLFAASNPTDIFTLDPGTLPLSWTQRTITSGSYKGMCWSTVLQKFIAINSTASSDAVFSSSNGTTWASLGTLPDTSAWIRVIETEDA